jgi:hypothetical protein
MASERARAAYRSLLEQKVGASSISDHEIDRFITKIRLRMVFYGALVVALLGCAVYLVIRALAS